jgi:CRISPR-associated protein Cmr5
MSKATSTIRKLEQGRAEFAYRCAEQATQELEAKQQENYLSYSKKLLPMILNCGLGQSLAFVKAKAKDNKAYKLLYSQITEYLKESNTTTRIKMLESKTDVVEWVVSCDTSEYRLITKELLSFLTWLKRFAEGKIEKE